MWVHWTHCGLLVAQSICQLTVLNAKTFSEISTQFRTLNFWPRIYANAYVQALNDKIDGAVDLDEDNELMSDIDSKANIDVYALTRCVFRNTKYVDEISASLRESKKERPS